MSQIKIVLESEQFHAGYTTFELESILSSIAIHLFYGVEKGTLKSPFKVNWKIEEGDD